LRGKWGAQIKFSMAIIFDLNYFLKKFNVDESTVQEALLEAEPHNEHVIAYHLIIDNKRITEGNG
jgi:hypothetical protein